MNTTTPRLFIAATRQNEGKTTTSLGLLAAIQKSHPRVGYIKPVGQRFVEIDEQKIDEDTVLMDRVYQLNCPLVDMSPIAVEPDFTRRYLEQSNYEALVRNAVIRSNFAGQGDGSNGACRVKPRHVPGHPGAPQLGLEYGLPAPDLCSASRWIGDLASIQALLR